MSERKQRLVSRVHQRGFALVESLIGILLLSVGILGLVGLQASMIRKTADAQYRTQAAFLADDVVGRIWADKANIANYKSSKSSNCTSGSCVDWLNKVASTLPAGTATIDLDSSGILTVSVDWATPDGAHEFKTSALIQ
jgi:type IV pilus assembly protein PilV